MGGNMILFFNKVIGSIIQIVLFGMIPFVWWLVTARKKQKFTQWMGMTKIEGDRDTLRIMILGTMVFLVLGALTLYMLRDIKIATSEFEGLGIQAIPAIIVYAVFHTAFPEELLFRGFLLKRLKNKMGFHLANFIQAFIFGLLHGIMLFGLIHLMEVILIITFTGVIGWFMGYINEKKSSGSILPGWMIHTVSNLFSGICAAFSII